MKYLILLVLAVTVAVSAYDFKDADFNEVLFDELQADFDEANIESISVKQRRRREVDEVSGESKKECGRREWKKDFLCCTGDKFDPEQYASYKEAKKQCYTEVRGSNADDSFDPFDCEKMQKVKEQMVCVSECVAKKFNLVEESGALKRDAILEHLRTKVGDVQWKKDGLESFVDKCMGEVKEKREKAIASDSTVASKGCSPCALDFHHCIWREFGNGCPAELRVDTPKCNKIRERLAKGDTSFLNKHFLHQFHEKRHDE